MEIRVLLFGPLAWRVGLRQIEVSVDNMSPTCVEVRDEIARVEPRLAPMLPHCRLAVNHEFVAEGRRINPGDEVALIGLVSGG